jgi:hypothetical protein
LHGLREGLRRKGVPLVRALHPVARGACGTVVFCWGLAVGKQKSADARGFWAGKTPCWRMRGCINEACFECVAYRDQSKACWEHPDTLCKHTLGVKTCFTCRVFQRYGQ